MAISNPTEALRIVSTCAALYEKNLSGKNVLFATVDDDKSACVETLFQPQNFLHLTGLQTNLSSERFYDAALECKYRKGWWADTIKNPKDFPDFGCRKLSRQR